MRYQIHYRSFFTLHFDQKGPDSDARSRWSALIKTVGEWLFYELGERNANLTGIIRTWLFDGGDWFGGLSDVRLSTRVFRGSQAEGEPPLHWAIRFDRRDPTVDGRSWRTELGLNFRPETDRVDCVLTHSFAGPFGVLDSKLPAAQVPELAFRFFDCSEWSVSINNESVFDFPKELLSGQEEGFLRLLKSTDRQLPVVLVNLMELPEDLGFEMTAFADLLALNAHIFYYSSPLVESKMRHLLGAAYGFYRCHDGARIFLTSIDFENADDHKRHRYFLWPHYEKAEDFELAVFLQFLRPKKWPFQNFVATLEDVAHRDRLKRMDSMRAELAQNDEMRAFFKMMDDENNDLREKNADLKNLVEQKETVAEGLEETLREASKTISRLQFERAETDRKARSQEVLGHSMEPFLALEHLPKKLPDTVRAMEAIFSDRLLFLPEARESSIEADWEDVGTAWTALFQMATSLWHLVFEKEADPFTIMQEFKGKTGHELSFTDNKHTKANDQSRRERLILHNGELKEFQPHIKINKGGRFLRVHFIIDKTLQKIVIGHCGDHLTTAGTRRTK